MRSEEVRDALQSRGQNMIPGRQPIFIVAMSVLYVVGACFFSCSTGVESSPDPGIVRVTLQSDPADTSILIVNEIFTVSEGDNFMMTIFQGKAYSDSSFGILFTSKQSYREQQLGYNIIDRQNDQYSKFVIFESYLPPSDYDRIQFGVTASALKLGNFEIPVEIPEGTPPFVDLYHEFRVSEGRTTEISVRISPFKSVRRYRDTYQFIPQMEIVGVEHF